MLFNTKASVRALAAGVYGLVAALVTLSAWSSAGNVAAQQAIEIKRDIPAVEKPKDVPGLLRNIKTALDRGLFAREEFYQEAIINQYFSSAASRLYETRSPGGLVVEIAGYGDIVDPLKVEGGWIPGMTMRIHKVVSDSGRTTARVDLGGRLNVDFGTVEAIFGDSWIDVTTTSPQPHNPLSSSSVPHGDSVIEYKGPDFSWRANLRFNDRGMLNDTSFAITARP